MENFFFAYPLLAGLVVMSVSLIGVITLNRFFSRWTQTHLHLLVSFAAGVFIVVAVGIFREIANVLSLPTMLGLALAGIGLMYLLGKTVTDYHHHHREDTCEHTRENARPHALRILAADAVHNAGDGIMIATSFTVSVSLGIAVTLAVVLHETLQELSEFFVLRRAGLSVRQALVRNFLVSGTVLIGITGGLLLGEAEVLRAGVLAVAGGALLSVIAQDLAPHSLRAAQREGIMLPLFWAALGAGMMALITTLISA